MFRKPYEYFANIKKSPYMAEKHRTEARLPVLLVELSEPVTQ